MNQYLDRYLASNGDRWYVNGVWLWVPKFGNQRSKGEIYLVVGHKLVRMEFGYSREWVIDEEEKHHEE